MKSQNEDYTFQPLDTSRNLVWDLLRDTDEYYLNHHVFQIDFQALENLRQEMRKNNRPVPSYVCMVLYAMARTLPKFPVFNSYLRTWPLTRLALYKGVDLAYTALKTDSQGNSRLSLSILKNCDNLSFQEFCAAYSQQCQASLEECGYYGVLKFFSLLPNWIRFLIFRGFCKPFPKIMRRIGGTAAFTSVGKFGVDITTPLSPKSITLSLGAVKPRTMAVNGESMVRMSAFITLTYDHRIADGAQCSDFGQALREFIEQGIELEESC